MYGRHYTIHVIDFIRQFFLYLVLYEYASNFQGIPCIDFLFIHVSITFILYHVDYRIVSFAIISNI